MLPYSLLRYDSRFGMVAAPGMALGVNQPANIIQVRVSYPIEFGYRETTGPGVKPVQNRGRLNYEMVYAPLPGR